MSSSPHGAYSRHSLATAGGGRCATRVVVQHAVRGLLLAALAVTSAGAGEAQTPLRQTEILWDTWGVPHVYARNDDEMGYGFGWAQARGHADEILRLYGLARGRGAEYWGEQYVPSDRLVRELGIPALGGRQAAGLAEPLRSYVQAFADGFNAYAQEHPDRIPDSLRIVLPVTPGDVMAHGDRALFVFVATSGNEPPLVGGNGMPPESRRPGSNTWAIGAKRSASGHAMLLQNPHLPWNRPLLHFTEAQLASPAGQVYGVTLIGLPVIAIGFNRYLGWSHTVNTIDALDTYGLHLVPGGYRWEGGERAFEEWTDTMRVKGADGTIRVEPLTIRRALQGPVIRQNDTLAIAVRTTGLDADSALIEWWDMGRAHDLASFQVALRELGLPMFNVSYADRDGHILYFYAGRVPERSHGDFALWQGTVSGDSEANLWHAILPFDSLPRIVDPPAGFIENSNSPPWYATIPTVLDPKEFPAYLAPDWLDMREQRGLHMLLADSSITYDELVRMRYSNHMELADRVLPALLPAAEASKDSVTRRAGQVLARWDRAADAGSRGAVLFEAWAGQVFRGPSWAAHPTGFATGWSRSEPISTPTGLADPAAAAAVLGKVARAVERRYGRLDVAYGVVNRLGEYPGNGAPGDPFGIFHVIGYAPMPGQKTAQGLVGDTWVAAIEFAPGGPHATAILTYGNSTQPDSRHVRDQLKLESEKKMRPVWTTRVEVEAHLESKTEVPHRP